ncbi:MAG: Ig-like domain-containing protein [Bacilli bacterium]|nr:Ig-like domain-containing protein [Bacilli bacterium]
MIKKLPISVLALVGSMILSSGGFDVKDHVVPTRAVDLANVIRAEDGDYVLVKKASDLVSGSKVIIAANAYNYAMSATQSTSNRGRVAITKTTNADGYNIATFTGNVGQFTLGNGTSSGTYSFYDANYAGYLYAGSSSSNQLKTQSNLTANSSFTISIASSGVATVKATGSNTRNTMKYNSTSKIFACYSSGQKDIAIYKYKVNDVPANVAVTGVTLDKTSANVEVGDTFTLNATVAPSNATNKKVNWATSNSAVASVANGVVTAKAAGNATITVTTEDGNKVASCAVTVKAVQVVPPGDETVITIEPNDISASYSSYATEIDGQVFTVSNVRRYSSTLQFQKSNGYILNNDALPGLKTVTLETYSGRSFSGTLYSGTEAASTARSQSVRNGYTYNIPEGDEYFALLVGSSTGYLKSIKVTFGESAQPVEISPTGISFGETSGEMKVGATKQLTVDYVPANVNANKGVTFASNNTAVATVNSNGLVTAKAAGNATITATSTYNPNLKATYAVTVKENAVVNDKDAWTIMIYMCGADLESTSSYRLATADIKEILSVSGQPDDVNIIIQTGGAKSWASTYGVSANYSSRWHVANKQLVKDVDMSKVNMGLTSTFQSFLEWGLNNYPAEKTGVVLWNHGGAMRGVCYDEQFNDDCLLNSEVNAALAGAFNSTNQNGKLEFIGYDACLMQVQDVAEFNSNYFNYMIGSEESESGYGWDYDTWVDDLYAKKPTTTILKAVVDGFIADNGGVSNTRNNQTLSYLNLANMPVYKNAWENMASALSNKVTSSNKSSFKNLVNSVKHYADNDYTYFGVFDAKDFINKLAANSTFNPGSTYTNAVLSAHANLVEYSSCGKGAGNSYGLTMFYAISSNCQKGTYYTAAQTNFNNWRAFNNSFGY